MRIRELVVKCNDIAGTITFYRKLLNAEPTVQSKTEVSFVAGESLLSFQHTDIIKPQYHFAFDIPINLLHDALRWVSSFARIIPASEKEIIADFKNWNAHSFYFFDNNENILEFICRYDRNIKAVDFFDGRQVINISEAAVACDSISEMMADLHQKFSLQPYEKQPPLDNFAAIGDVCGLFILSASGRSWFPTKVAAKHFPICVRFEERGYDYEFRKD